jgi:hypothetical protein
MTTPLNLPAPGRRQCVYGALCGLAHTCVFATQSLGPIHCDPISLERRPCGALARNRASLLPKLRDQYAEFLDHVSLVHLRLLASPTCVGLRYGRFMHCPTKLFSTVDSRRLAIRVAPGRSRSRLDRLVKGRSTRFDGQSTQPLLLCSSVPWGVMTHTKRGRNLRRLSIGYASGASP